MFRAMIHDCGLCWILYLTVDPSYTTFRNEILLFINWWLHSVNPQLVPVAPELLGRSQLGDIFDGQLYIWLEIQNLVVGSTLTSTGEPQPTRYKCIHALLNACSIMTIMVDAEITAPINLTQYALIAPNDQQISHVLISARSSRDKLPQIEEANP